MKRFLICCVLFALLPLGCKAKTVPEKLSGRGQTCSASNDCEQGLLCISSTCIQNDYPVEPTAKVCNVIECGSDAECCENFDRPADCDEVEAACDPSDPFTESICSYAEQYCQCNEVCNENQRCVQPAETCTSDDDCGFSGLCDTSTGACVQCLTADDCADEGDLCTDGMCTSGCEKNEDCPLFHSCNVDSGQCNESGCTSDRECILFTGVADAVCKKEEGSASSCTIPCEENAECGSLNICQEGECVFLGCETDDDCRTYLRLTGTNPVYGEDARAVCVPQESSTDDGAMPNGGFDF